MAPAWYITDGNDDSRQNEEHHPNSDYFLTMDKVKEISGVEYFKINVDNINGEEELRKLKEERGYNYEDQIEISEKTLPDYDKKIRAFYAEHLHTDDEIRLFVDGGGYFDVRDKDDKWIRIHVGKGDLIILPAGIYHRFALDKHEYAKITRLCCRNPVWSASNRPTGDGPSKKE